ncbi:GNAT family N-acetyltransferase [Pengzhenrongella frigida]|uniref:GNAT family N-acetyltransferase n=1 Tax=Pengzhenrongella frigida TaxID=1259133 RepID=A0A4Q5MXA1_9MICO|nr:GNAT family N-acetyltransferase [Cellulomonas sp. HLT2-17]RYV50235.1 GNAT family N-acetyltransferase [Cellulomonas sp. HLT2-17]
MTAPSGITIRLAHPHEHAEVGLLTVAGFAAGPYGAATDPDRVALLHDAAGRAEAGELLVAVDDATGELVGTASLLRAGARYSRRALPDEAEVRLLATSQAGRGRGVGAALMESALERARGWGVTALVVDTGPGNLTAQRLYHRLGFERVPERETTHIPGVGVLIVFRFALQPGDGVLVRLVRVEELDRVSELSVSAYAGDFGDLSPTYLASIADVAPRALEHEVWVAEDRATGALLGTVATPRPGSHISPLGRPGELDFRLLAVDPAARGRGLGTLLTCHVIRLARLRGLRRVVLNSGPEMFTAHRLYERLGFVRLPERETFLPDGRRLYAFGLDLPD